MSRAGRGEPRPPHDLIGAWSDTADPNNRILSRPVSVPSARSRRARKERSETCKTNRHPAPAGRSSAGSTPTPTRTGCASSTGGAAGSCPAGSPADAAGYEALAGAIAAAGEPACVAMEGTSSYGAGLTRHLASLGMPVREALSPAGMQRRRPGQGKCDEADAERAARAAMSGSRLGTPKSQDGWVDGVRCMLAARSGAVKARTSAINTARSLLTTAPEGLRSRFRGMGGPRLMEELPSVRAEGALGAALGALADLWAAARDAALDMELAIEASLEENCPALLAMYGCGPVSAAKLAVAAGDNPGRLRSEASFAAICGACPIPASSGKTVRHRLNRGGDRQANSALHEIARQRVMRDPETAEYAERARARGKSDREVMRCLKRYVAREAYRALMRPHEIRRPEDASELVAARRAAKVSQVRAASILGTSEKYISMLERGQRELKPIRRAYEAWVEAGLPLDWDRQAFEAERKMDSKKHLAK
ncbi:MAG: transposase [Collinsella sp.]